MATVMGKTRPIASGTDPTNPTANGLDHQGIAIKKRQIHFARASLP